MQEYLHQTQPRKFLAHKRPTSLKEIRDKDLAALQGLFEAFDLDQVETDLLATDSEPTSSSSNKAAMKSDELDLFL